MAMNCETVPERWSGGDPMSQTANRLPEKSGPADDPKRKIAILAVSTCNQGKKNRTWQKLPGTWSPGTDAASLKPTCYCKFWHKMMQIDPDMSW